MSDYDDRIAARNRVNLARWAKLWYERGGAIASNARDFTDWRTDEERERWRAMETVLREHFRTIQLREWQKHMALVHEERKVVKFERARRARAD